jgi:uncharacterized protein YeaO (DUF488 family)
MPRINSRVAPCRELRKWLARPKEVAKLSRTLSNRAQRSRRELKLLKSKAKEGTVTLIYGARDQEHNEALVLKEFLERMA